MPSASLRYCAESGCPEKVRHGRCAQHTQQVELDRGSSTQRGYTYRWQQRSKAFLGLYYLCGMRPLQQAPVMSQCHIDGRFVLAKQVDHVIPHRGNQQLFWDEIGNWQALCASCGWRKTQAGL